MTAPLFDLLPSGAATADDLLDRFLGYVDQLGLTLYPAQEEAILALLEDQHVILNTPTGSGKSLAAFALHFASLARGRRSVYTCPIKALVNEKWMALCREFGPENVGLATGDATVNRDAPLLCCTAEILANLALREGELAAVDDVVMDEFHWYADRDRGVAWQAPLLTLPQARFLLMSATLGDVTFFEEELTRRTGRPTATVTSSERPVPLEFSYSEEPLARAVERLVEADRVPVYVVHFTQKDAAASAQSFTSLKIATREEKKALAAAVEGVRFSTPYGPRVRTWLKHGIGIHHAGLLPRYRVLAEQLAQRGLLKVIWGTDTLGVGVNVPIRTVLFSRLSKYDGEKTAVLSARDFHQIAGRAGRKGFDERGYVVVQAPEHVIENRRLAEKAKAGKKVVRRRPPRNFAPWDEQTFERLVRARPERLRSRFAVSHGMLLNVLSRRGDGCLAMRQLVRDSHESEAAKRMHRRRGWQLFRSLVTRKVVEIVPRTAEGSRVRVNVDLQDDFSMDQALSLYLIETVPLLDPDAETHALDLLTLVESILENPAAILRRQLDKRKDAAVAEMKAAGMEYEERMEELEKIEHPKPLADFVYTTFNDFADRHPWVGEENARPKSIAREMFETFLSFSDYVREYGSRTDGGPAPAAPLERLQGAPADGARRPEDRRGRGDGAVPPGPRAPGGCESARGMGADARRRLPARDGGRPRTGRGSRRAGRRHARCAVLHRRHPHALVRPAARLVDRRRRGRARRPRHAARRDRAGLDGRAPGAGARGVHGRERRPAPGSRGAQPEAHVHPAVGRRRDVAGRADAGGRRGAQRLGGGAGGGPGRLARRRRAGHPATASGGVDAVARGSVAPRSRLRPCGNPARPPARLPPAHEAGAGQLGS